MSKISLSTTISVALQRKECKNISSMPATTVQGIYVSIILFYKLFYYWLYLWDVDSDGFPKLARAYLVVSMY